MYEIYKRDYNPKLAAKSNLSESFFKVAELTDKEYASLAPGELKRKILSKFGPGYYHIKRGFLIIFRGWVR